ncbi:MAG: radical SAM protein [Oscillospiraceae bacterium]|nr:radical SAM protein [Oscillospiraceae bacterium]
MAQKMNILDKLHQPFVIQRVAETDWSGTGTTKGPLVVEFDTTEACNLACPGCISEDLVSHRTSFSNERLMELGKEMYEIGVKAVVLIGGGEPLAHPKVGDFISYLGEHDIHVGITTNGYFIDRYMDTIAQYSKWTRISMDAATAETFDKLRPGKDGNSKFDHIVDNMRKLAKVKKGALGFSFLIRTEADGFGIESNIHEIYAAAELARDIGCDYFEVKPSYSYADGQNHALVKHDPVQMKKAREQIDRLPELERPGFKIIKAINLEDSLNCVDTKQEKDYHKCIVSDFRTLITPSGVYICPYWRGKDKFRIGNAFTQSIEEIWNSEQRRKVMEFSDPCTVCDFHCLRDESNKELFRMIKSSPEEIKSVEEYDRFI